MAPVDKDYSDQHDDDSADAKLVHDREDSNGDANKIGRFLCLVHTLEPGRFLRGMVPPSPLNRQALLQNATLEAIFRENVAEPAGYTSCRFQ